MARQSISLTRPNDEWLKSLVDSEEYSSKSEVINDLIRREREKDKEIEWIRAKLIKAEKSLESKGFVNKSSDGILEDIKEKARNYGDT